MATVTTMTAIDNGVITAWIMVFVTVLAWAIIATRAAIVFQRNERGERKLRRRAQSVIDEYRRESGLSLAKIKVSEQERARSDAWYCDASSLIDDIRQRIANYDSEAKQSGDTK